jgi:hypothetical protein
MGFGSCTTTSYLKHDFGKMESYKNINGIYADSASFVAGVLRIGGWNGGYPGDSINIYKFETEDGNRLSLYGFTSDGFRLIKQFKGKFNEEKHYFETSVYNYVLPVILFTIVGKEKVRIGKTADNQLLINKEETDVQLFLVMGGGNVRKWDKALPPADPVLYLKNKTGENFPESF